EDASSSQASQTSLQLFAQTSLTLMIRSGRSHGSNFLCFLLGFLCCCFPLGFALEHLQLNHVVPFHFLQGHADELYGVLQIRNHLELQTVDTPLGAVDILDEPYHGGLDLCSQDDLIQQNLIGIRSFINSRTGPYDAVASFVHLLLYG